MGTYASHTIDSKNLIKRWFHRQRFDSSLGLLDLKPGQHCLDYGCGDGELTLRICRKIEDINVVAYDPADSLLSQAKSKLNGIKNCTVTASLESVPGTFDRIACLETVEHLPTTELMRLFDDIRQRLAPNGRCLFTFPIEHGMASIVKNTSRRFSHSDRYASVRRMFCSTLGAPIEREPAQTLSGCNYIYSHVGFSCRNMLKSIKSQFSVVRRGVIPAGIVPIGLGYSMAIVVKNLPGQG
jgi:SAM-dependent methyltransferase